MKWRWVLGVPLVLVGSCAALLGAAASRIAADHVEGSQRAAADLFRAHSERFIADQERLVRLRIMAARAGPDAGALLSDKLGAPSAPDRSPDVFTPELARALDQVRPRSWPGPAVSLDISTVDTAWMAQLAEFGFWDPLRSPEVERLRPLVFSRAPLPVMLNAQRWAKVRMLQGLRGDLARAGREVEELVRLLLSSELRQAEMVAIGCLQVARATWDHATQLALDTGDWIPPTTEDIRALERVHRASLAYVDLEVDTALADVVTSNPSTTVGRCAALQEVATFALAVAPSGSPVYGPSIDRTMRLLDENDGRCRFTALAGAWRTPDQRAVQVGVDAICHVDDVGIVDCVLTSVMLGLPGFRDLAVAMYTAGAPQTAFLPYAQGSERVGQ